MTDLGLKDIKAEASPHIASAFCIIMLWIVIKRK